LRTSRHYSQKGFATGRIAFVLALMLAYCATASARQTPSTSDGKASYGEMVKRLKSGDLTINFLDLRMAYAARPQYDPEEGSDKIRDMYSKLNAKDFKGALNIANDILAKQYVNIDAHVVASAAYERMGDQAAAKLHHDIVVGLVRSILSSAKGVSTATAYKVISIQEEYAVMRIRGLRPGKQSYLHEGKRSFDEMEMVDPRNNSTVTYYFDVTLSDQQMYKSFGK
jgi:hypothetical protein